MDKRDAIDIAIKYANAVRSKYDFTKIILFGSYAKGNYNEDSDIDLLIVKDTIEPRHKRSIEMQRLLKGSKLPVDILVYTNDEFDREKSNHYSFVNSAISGAKLMYERK